MPPGSTSFSYNDTSANTDNGFGAGGNDGMEYNGDAEAFGRKPSEADRKYAQDLLASGFGGAVTTPASISGGGGGGGGDGGGGGGYKPQFRTFNRDSAVINNGYGDSLGSALAGAQSRSTPLVAGQTISTDQQNQFRQNQIALAQQLQVRAAGKAPSAAEIQMGAGMAEIARQQRAQAAGARGLSPALAQRMATQNIAAAQQQQVSSAGALRANEQAAAEQAFGQHLANARGQDLGLATNQAGMLQQASLANQSTELQNRAQMDAATAQYIGMGMQREEAEQQARMDFEGMKTDYTLGVQNIKANLQTGQQSVDAQREAARQQRNAAYINAGATLGAAAVSSYGKSDKRSKEDIKDGGKVSDAFLDGLKAYTFRYKEPSDGPGEHFGVMAQDIEKLPGGKGMVVESPEGVKMLHAGQGIGRLLAVASRLNERVNKLEGKGARS